MNQSTSAVVGAFRAKALAALRGDIFAAPAIAESMYGKRHPAALLVQKAGIPMAGTTGDAEGLTTESEEVAAFMAEVAELALLGRMAGVVRVGATQPFAVATQRLTGYWAGEKRAVRVSPAAFDREKLKPKTVTAIVPMTEEFLEDSSPRADAILRAMLRSACARAADAALIDASNVGSDAKPASITAGSKSFLSLGSLEDDLQQAVYAFTGNWSTAYWLLSPQDAALIALKDGGNGTARGLGARGGELLGLPALTAEAVPRGQISLVDASGVALVDEGAEFTVSTEATIELDTSPTGDGGAPAGASANVVNLFQIDAVAFKVSQRLNWASPDKAAGRVVTITGADFLQS